MQYFTEQAFSHREALEKIRTKYGDQAKVLTQRSVRMGGFLGMFAREGVELSGYISADGRKTRPGLEEEKQKILKNVKDDQTLQQLLKEVQFIKERIDATPAETKGSEEHETLTRLGELLEANDFTREYTSRILTRLKHESSLDELDDFRKMQDRVVTWIGESVRISDDAFRRKPRVFVLVGPTGVGKTTTIAKLAAVFGLGTGGVRTKSVRMLTIDNYRIGARQQIETYGDIMGIPVDCVESYTDLRKRIALYSDVDLILIDTIGKSPKDYMKLAEMRELLDACGSLAEVYLAVSATTKTVDLREILRQFEPFNYEAVILTKLDETMHIGNIISVLAEKQKPIAYVTNGQVVPQDIDSATVTGLLMHLEGFQIDQDRIDRIFGRNSIQGRTNHG
jgi:flagellar biosynthesis protein FlhF